MPMKKIYYRIEHEEFKRLVASKEVVVFCTDKEGSSVEMHLFMGDIGFREMLNAVNKAAEDIWKG